MNKVQMTIAALAFGMFTMAPAFADNMSSSTSSPTDTCVCPADKADCKVDANAEDCVKNGGTVKTPESNTNSTGTENKTEE